MKMVCFELTRDEPEVYDAVNAAMVKDGFFDRYVENGREVDDDFVLPRGVLMCADSKTRKAVLTLARKLIRTVGKTKYWKGLDVRKLMVADSDVDAVSYWEAK